MEINEINLGDVSPLGKVVAINTNGNWIFLDSEMEGEIKPATITRPGVYVLDKNGFILLYDLDVYLHLWNSRVELCQPTAKKPPFGIRPKKAWMEERKHELIECIERYISKELPLNIEWIEEYNELTKQI